MLPRESLLATGRFILDHARIRLLLHTHPDGDSMGSCLGLARFLRGKGKQVEVIRGFEKCPAKFDFLAGFADIRHGRTEVRNPDFEDALYCVVDSTGLDRTGFEEGDFQRVLRIDHHIGGSHYHELDLLDSTSASASLIVTDMVRALGEDAVDAETATCLYTGLMTDTGGFRYSSTDAHAFLTAAFLVEQGADPARCAGMIHDRRGPHYLTLLRQAADSVSFHFGGKVALLLLRPEDLPEEARGEFGSDEFINLPRSLAQVQVVVQMKKSLDGDWKVGFRGKGEINVQAVAADLGGGGHFSASGCELEGSEDEVRQRIFDRIGREFEEDGSSA